ncbi:MAG: DMT family transporter [Flavobacteriales bacterium]
MQRSQILNAHLALLLVNVLYGANHVLAKGVMPRYLDPNTFILLRVSGATILFWILLYFQKRKPIERSDFWRFGAAGLFGVAVNQLFFFHGLNLSSAFNAGIIMALNPMMVVILSAILMKEKLRFQGYFGIAIGALGAILLTLSSGKLPGASSIGDLFLLINSLSYALYLVLSKPLLQKYSPIQVITYVFSIGLLFLLIFPPTWTQLGAAHFDLIPAAAWYKITYVIVGVTFLTYLLTIFGLKYVSATISSAYIYTQPVMVALFTFLFAYVGWAADFSNTITAERIFYMLLIFTGVYFVSLRKPRP